MSTESQEQIQALKAENQRLKQTLAEKTKLANRAVASFQQRALHMEVIRQQNEDLDRLTSELAQAKEQAEEQAAGLKTVAEVSAKVVAELTEQVLLQEVVDLTKERFDLYHAQIYLLDEARGILLLVAGYGEVGQAMVSEGWQIPLDTQTSLVARAAREKRGVVEGDTHQATGFFANPLLPDTRSEMAVPMIVGAQVLGVLDVQCTEVGRFTDHDVQITATLASQVAVALKNARQYEETQVALRQATESQERLALIVEGTNDGVWDWDIRTNIIYFSPRWKAMIGYQDHEISNDFSEFESRLHPEDHDRMMQAVADYLEGRRETYEEEFRFRHKDGSYRWILVRGKLVRDEDGLPLRMAGSHTDITNRKTVEADLLKFKLGIERVGDPFFLTDVDGTITYVNAAFETVYGYSREEAIGQTPRILKSGLVPQEGYERFWKALLNKKIVSGEVVNKTKDGRLIDIDGSNNPIISEAGEIIGFLGIHRDISERKKLLSEAEHRTRRERIIRQITERMREAGSLDELIRVTASELGEKLSAGHALLEMGVETEMPPWPVNGTLASGNFHRTADPATNDE